jgi:hypothetical protein
MIAFTLINGLKNGYIYNDEIGSVGSIRHGAIFESVE